MKWSAVIEGFLEKEGMAFTKIKSSDSFVLEVSGEKKIHKVLIIVGDEDSQEESFLVIVAMDSRVVPESRRSDVLAAINDLSYKNAIGGYELHGGGARVVFKYGRHIQPGLQKKVFVEALYHSVACISQADEVLKKVID